MAQCEFEFEHLGILRRFLSGALPTLLSGAFWFGEFVRNVHCSNFKNICLHLLLRKKVLFLTGGFFFLFFGFVIYCDYEIGDDIFWIRTSLSFGNFFCSRSAGADMFGRKLRVRSGSVFGIVEYR